MYWTETPQQLEPRKTADPKRTAVLMADLDSVEFAVGEQARRQLEVEGEVVEAARKQAGMRSGSPEHRQRIGGLLKRLGGWSQSTSELRVLCSLEVLEWINTAESRQLLRELAASMAQARLAKGSLSLE